MALDSRVNASPNFNSDAGYKSIWTGASIFGVEDVTSGPEVGTWENGSVEMLAVSVCTLIYIIFLFPLMDMPCCPVASTWIWVSPNWLAKSKISVLLIWPGSKSNFHSVSPLTRASSGGNIILAWTSSKEISEEIEISRLTSWFNAGSSLNCRSMETGEVGLLLLPAQPLKRIKKNKRIPGNKNFL